MDQQGRPKKVHQKVHRPTAHEAGMRRADMRDMGVALRLIGGLALMLILLQLVVMLLSISPSRMIDGENRLILRQLAATLRLAQKERVRN
jgi:hypothetical protein